MENFIGGLQVEIKGMIRLLEPTTLEQALKLARFYEQTLTSQTKKNGYTGGSYKAVNASGFSSKVGSGGNTNTKNNNTSLLVSNKIPEVINTNPRPLTFSQREERRQKGLYFYCDEKFVKGHECKKPQSFLIIAEEEETGDYESEQKFDEAPGEETENWKDQKIILAALGMEAGGSKPLQFTGLVGNKGMEILIDGGSSKNLINSQLCKELNLNTLPQEPVVLQLPNGATLISQVLCPELKWTWNGVEFSSAAQVVDLSDWQIILGIEWLSQLGDVNCNYKDHTMQVQWKGQ